MGAPVTLRAIAEYLANERDNCTAEERPFLTEAADLMRRVDLHLGVDPPPPHTILVHIDVALGPQGPVQTDWRVVPMTFVPMPGITLTFGDNMDAPTDSLSVQAQIVRIGSDGATHVHLLCTKIGAAVLAASPSMLERLPPVGRGR